MTSRQRSGRAVNLEFLEDRALLSAAAVTHPAALVASAAAPKAPAVIQGNLTGLAQPYINAKAPAYNTVITASGNASGRAGLVSLVAYQKSGISGATALITNGRAVINIPGAGKTLLTVTYTGQGHATESKTSQTLSLTGTITGGGGAYAGATGTFKATVGINPSNGAFTMRYVLTVVTKG